LIADDGRPAHVPGGTDIAVTVTGAMLLLIYTVVRLEHLGQGWVWTLALFVTGLMLATIAYALLPAMIVLGVAFALDCGPLTNVATDGVAMRNKVSFQFGAALGLSVVTAVNVAATSRCRSPMHWRPRRRPVARQGLGHFREARAEPGSMEEQFRRVPDDVLSGTGHSAEP
jgi:hypothetical protein